MDKAQIEQMKQLAAGGLGAPPSEREDDPTILTKLARRLVMDDAVLVVAEALAATLMGDQRSLFRIGCGLAEGGAELLEQALARGREALRFADPRPHLSALRVPVLVAHGRDDDVIPWNEARKLAGAVAPSTVVRLAITGLFGHTGAVLPSPRALASELGNLSTLLRGLVDAPRGGFR